jgi:hypothetical protein
MAALSKVLSAPPAVLNTVPPWVFGDQISPDGITELQQDYIEFGGLVDFSTPIAPSRLIDSSLIDAVEAEK